MSDLISRKAAIDAVAKWLYDVFGIKESDGTATIFKRLRELPPAEPQERTGKWVDKGWTGDWQYKIDGRGNCWRDIRCSECNTSVTHESNFCPNCGAKMEVEHGSQDNRMHSK